MRDFFESQTDRLGAVLSFPFEDRGAYSRFLAQTHHYVLHSTRLIGLTASRIGPEREKMHMRFLESAAEEKSHHLLAAHDLKELGSALEDHPEHALTAAFYRSQYYQVSFTRPTSIFGYILALEGLAFLHGEKIYERVRAAHGATAATFVRVHADEDPNHVAQVFEIIDVLDEDERALVRKNFLQTTDLYALLLRELATGGAS